MRLIRSWRGCGSFGRLVSRHRVPLLLIAVAGAGLTLGPAAATGQSGGTTRPLFATLDGQNEIGQNGKRGAGDTNGFGAFTMIRVGNRTCAAYAVRNIAKPVSAGVFRGRSTVNGQPNFNVLLPASGDPGAKGFCNTPRLGAQLDRMWSNPSDYYVDVAVRRFRSDYSGGAIRGQLRATRSGAAGALVATIRGGTSGDDDAYGALTAIRDGNTLCYGLVVADLDGPTQVAIQRPGAEPVQLRTPTSGNRGFSAGCIDDVGGLDDIFSTPGGFTVDIATSEFPDGAARGQLARSG